MNQPDDETLARRARHDTDALSMLYARYVNRVYSYLLSRVGNVQDAQDLTTQTFLALIEGLSSYQNQQKFQGWLMSIAYRKLMDHFRSQKDAVALEQIRDVIADPAPPDASVDLRLDAERMFSRLRHLSEDQAEALTLYIFGDMGAAEIGQLMNRSESAVRMLIYRAIRNLRERLMVCAPGEDYHE